MCILYRTTNKPRGGESVEIRGVSLVSYRPLDNLPLLCAADVRTREMYGFK